VLSRGDAGSLSEWIPRSKCATALGSNPPSVFHHPPNALHAQAELAAAATRIDSYRDRYRLQLAADQRVLSQDIEGIKVGRGGEGGGTYGLHIQ